LTFCWIYYIFLEKKFSTHLNFLPFFVDLRSVWVRRSLKKQPLNLYTGSGSELMKLSELAIIIDGSFLTGKDQSGIEIDKAGGSDLMSDVLAALSENGVLLTGLTTNQAVKTAVISGVTAIVFVRNKEPDTEIIELARMHGIPLLSTPCSMFVACGRLYAKGLTGLSGLR
jgi:hypothetical protein